MAPHSITENRRFTAKLIGNGFDRTCWDMVRVITPRKSAVNLGFSRGVELPDPMGLLAGTGKHAQHVKITDASDVPSPALRTLLKAAAAMALGTTVLGTMALGTTARQCHTSSEGII